MPCPGHLRPWQPDELTCLRRWAGRVPGPVIARQMQRTHQSIRMKAEDLGLKLRVPGYTGVAVAKFEWPEDLKGELQ
jgi:hypothetical protein